MEGIAELAHNKVLVASTLSCTIWQLSKAFTAVFEGKRIDPKVALLPGRMPFAHSTVGRFNCCCNTWATEGVGRKVGYHAKKLLTSLTQVAQILTWQKQKLIPCSSLEVHQVQVLVVAFLGFIIGLMVNTLT
ncbi:hypothetical protein HPP92_002485 [Vanilla planifolia]|uniref:Uncharacterized protein n=1 Tax=Vanilla planifolia TaxID=51239 RepID=A0A835SES6_VANPL|nr:hypothetical protein HPP92_002485 [Vanilla planifolia]